MVKKVKAEDFFKTRPCDRCGSDKGRDLFTMSWFDCGIIVSGQMTTVHMINMWGLVSGSLGSQLKGVEKKNYETIDALLEDGWVVD